MAKKRKMRRPSDVRSVIAVLVTIGLFLNFYLTRTYLVTQKEQMGMLNFSTIGNITSTLENKRVTSLFNYVFPNRESNLTTRLITDNRILTSTAQSINFNTSETMETFANNVKFSVAEDGSSCRGRHFLIYSCGIFCGGWGDRQKGIVTTFLLALLTNRTFLISMPLPCDITNFLEPNIYDWKKCLPTVQHIDPKVKQHFGFMAGPVKDLQNLLTDEKMTKQIVSITTNSYWISKIRNHPHSHKMIPWLQNLSDPEVIGSIMGTLFKPSKEIIDAAVKFQKVSVQNRRLVCSHIRYGKNPTIPNDRNRKFGAPNVTMIFQFLARYANSAEFAIFIATDSIDVRNQSRQILPNFVSTETTIVHVDKTKPKTQAACDGFFAVLLEQLLLSKCDVLVLTRSNFGVIASYMRGHSDNLFLQSKDKTHVQQVNVSDIQPIYVFV